MRLLDLELFAALLPLARQVVSTCLLQPHLLPLLHFGEIDLHLVEQIVKLCVLKGVLVEVFAQGI